MRIFILVDENTGHFEYIPWEHDADPLLIELQSEGDEIPSFKKPSKKESVYEH